MGEMGTSSLGRRAKKTKPVKESNHMLPKGTRERRESTSAAIEQRDWEIEKRKCLLKKGRDLIKNEEAGGSIESYRKAVYGDRKTSRKDSGGRCRKGGLRGSSVSPE